MFIGHFAVGFVSKSFAPKVSLSWLVLASLFLDVLWPIFLVAGLESVRIDPGNTAVTPLDLHDYPYSHSLLSSIGWSLLFGLAFYALRRDQRSSLILGLAVFSHWILDFISHRADMPLYPGSATLVGLGLWFSKPGTIAVEGLLFSAGVFSYLKATRALNRKGTVGFWALAGFLVIVYAANLFGPPPPSVRAVIGGTFALWLFFPWMAWIDRHREPIRTGSKAGDSMEW